MKAFRNVTLLSLSLAALALMAAVPAAYADTLPESGSTTQTVVQSVPNMGTINIAQFNIPGNTLESVQVIMSIGPAEDNFSTYGVTYSGPSPATITTFDTFANYFLNALTIPTLDLSVSGVDSIPGGLIVPDGYSNTIGPVFLTGNSVSEYVSTAGWVGSGDVTFTLTGSASSGYLGTIPSGGNLALSPNTEGDASVEVIYTYTDNPPVPEPNTLVMFGTGLLGLAGMLRYKYLHSR